MSYPLRQNTNNQIVPLGPFLTWNGVAEDFVPAESLTIVNSDVWLHKVGATAEAHKLSGGATHMGSGMYRITLSSLETDVAGPLRVRVHVAGALPVQLLCVVYPADVYDALFAATGGSVRSHITSVDESLTGVEVPAL